MRAIPLLTFVLLAGPAAYAAGPPKMKAAATLRSASGEEVKSAGIVKEGKWLLMYVRPQCPTCDTMLLQFKPNPGEEQVADRVVVVVEGVDAAGLQAMSSRFDWLAAATWMADEDGEFRKSLELNVVPTAFGFRNGDIAWTSGGVMLDTGKARSVLTTWIKPPKRR